MIMIATLTIYNILRSYTICVEGLGAGERNGDSHWHQTTFWRRERGRGMATVIGSRLQS